MCLLWLLLQVLVLAMFWELPPVISEEGAAMLEMRQEEVNGEEVPLVGSNEEPPCAYRAVSLNQEKVAVAAAETQPVQGAPSRFRPFKKWSAGGGEGRPAVRSGGCQLRSPLTGGEGVTANAHVSYPMD